MKRRRAAILAEKNSLNSIPQNTIERVTDLGVGTWFLNPTRMMTQSLYNLVASLRREPETVMLSAGSITVANPLLSDYQSLLSAERE